MYDSSLCRRRWRVSVLRRWWRGCLKDIVCVKSFLCGGYPRSLTYHPETDTRRGRLFRDLLTARLYLLASAKPLCLVRDTRAVLSAAAVSASSPCIRDAYNGETGNPALNAPSPTSYQDTTDHSHNSTVGTLFQLNRWYSLIATLIPAEDRREAQSQNRKPALSAKSRPTRRLSFKQQTVPSEPSAQAIPSVSVPPLFLFFLEQ